MFYELQSTPVHYIPKDEIMVRPLKEDPSFVHLKSKI